MTELICGNCQAWVYDRYTEEKYGMGVGICSHDGSPQFCSHPCFLCDPPQEDPSPSNGSHPTP